VGTTDKRMNYYKHLKTKDMKQLEKILLPIDVNTDSKEQVNVAIDIARSYKSEIIIIYVLSENVIHNNIEEILMHAITDSLNKVKETIRKEGIRVKEPLIEIGKPVDNILKMAVKEEVNLIVAGSGTSSKELQFKLGNTVEKLIRHSDIPVLVVESDIETKITNILCPVDFSDNSRLALKNAILLAERFKASLRILSVLEPITSISHRISADLEKENAYLLEQYENEMKKFIKEFDLNHIQHTIDIQTGIAHENIVQTVKEHKHDLLVMGTTGRSGLRRILVGSVAEKVVRQVPCSFITIKEQDILQQRFDQDVKEIESHFNDAYDFAAKGNFIEAINHYKICLQINNMYIPAIYKLAIVHRATDDIAKADYYDDMAKKLLRSLWDETIEQEIRKHYT
jgi:nucleotide-binding universal stress UspA family protein